MQFYIQWLHLNWGEHENGMILLVHIKINFYDNSTCRVETHTHTLKETHLKSSSLENDDLICVSFGGSWNASFEEISVNYTGVP